MKGCILIGETTYENWNNSPHCKLFPLECEVDQEATSADDDDSEEFPGQSEGEGRPSRRAAIKFRSKLRNLIDSGELT